MKSSTPPLVNKILGAIARSDYQRLLPHLEPATLAFGEVLYQNGTQVAQIYFPIDCLISLLTVVDERQALEVGLVGREGLVGVSLALGVVASLVRVLMQGAGCALRLEAGQFEVELNRSDSLQRQVYGYALMAQIGQTAACNRFHRV